MCLICKNEDWSVTPQNHENVEWVWWQVLIYSSKGRGREFKKHAFHPYQLNWGVLGSTKNPCFIASVNE